MGEEFNSKSKEEEVCGGGDGGGILVCSKTESKIAKQVESFPFFDASKFDFYATLSRVNF